MKRKYYIPLGILCLFVVTNPSVKDFKDSLGVTSYDGLKRTSNYFILSTYRYNGNKYFGMIGNIWKEYRPADITILDSKADTLAKDTSTWKPPIGDKPVSN